MTGILVGIDQTDSVYCHDCILYTNNCEQNKEIVEHVTKQYRTLVECPADSDSRVICLTVSGSLQDS